MSATSINQLSLLSDIQIWHEQSLRYISQAFIFLDHDMHKECVTLAGMSVKATLKALYIKVNGNPLPFQHSYEYIIRNLQSCGELDLNAELFLNNLLLFAAHDDSLISNPPAEEHVRKLLVKTERMLQHLSAKVVDGDESSYQCVLA
ncbi:hypothetical protein [Paenibacillus vulneris]|uniref:HEPN domain-containing protein n=1 Tax=Paenibacillus vulneris TaxID=1133364 RepID=A0ABW3UYU0_9BACL